MKIGVCSDLHLEFGPVTIENPGDVKVLILSGDILVENDLDIYDRRQDEMGFMRGKSKAYHDFFKDVCSKFPYVLYIAGNHEHYHGDFAQTLRGLKEKLAHYKNLYVLDKEIITIDDVTFVGSTLWTNMNKEDPLTMCAISTMMNDFRIVKNSNRYVYRNVPVYKKDENGNLVMEKNDRGYDDYVQIGMKKKEEVDRFSPEDAVEENKKCFEYIKHIVSEHDKVVVIGHHTPSRQSCHPRYDSDDLMNGGYHNDYEEYIMDHPQIVLWTHGHTHERYDYMIGDTRVVCNPRGYIGYEHIADTFELKEVEV